MEKFLVLYMAPTASIDEMMKTMTPEQGKEGMDEWKKWMTERSSMFTDMGAPVGKNKRVTAGAIQDVRNEVTGYSIVMAESHEEAAKMFQTIPHFEIMGGYIDIMRLSDMGAMS